MSAASIVLNHCVAAIASLPALYLGKADRCLQARILRTVGPVVSFSAARCASLLGAFWAFGVLAGGVNVLGWDPGAAGVVGAVDSVSGWDGPFCFSVYVLFLRLCVDVWENVVRWDWVETAFGRPVSLRFKGSAWVG